MRKIFIVFALFAVNLSCLNAENTLKRNGNTFTFFNDTKKQIATQALDDDENVVSTKGNIPDGKIAEYGNDGKLVAEYQFRGGLKEGMTRLYYEPGKLHAEIAYSKGKKHGTVKYYFNTGNPNAEFIYQNGSREGNGKVFDKNGKLLWEGQYKAGSLNGHFTEYYANGKPAVVATYSGGKQTVKKAYDSNGALVKEKIILLYKETAVDVLPNSVSEFGDGTFFTLTKLTLDKDSLSGSLQLDSVQETEFVLAIYIKTAKQLVVVYKDIESEFTVAHMFGGGVTPMFSSRGYILKGKEKRQTVEFSIVGSMGNVYDVKQSPKTITIFCLKGSVNPHYFPKGENGVFASISNVLTMDMK